MLNLKGLNILILEDDPDTRSLLKDALKKTEAFVFEADNVRKAETVIQNTQIDCFLCDVRLENDEDGVQFAEIIQKNYPKIKTFVVTGYSDYDLKELRAKGFEDLIYKPFDLDIVVETVYSSLQEKKLNN